ncbi:MAG: hypothetical protein V4509_02000 [Patescibacteria group bacterium]
MKAVIQLTTNQFIDIPDVESECLSHISSMIAQSIKAKKFATFKIGDSEILINPQCIAYVAIVIEQKKDKSLPVMDTAPIN